MANSLLTRSGRLVGEELDRYSARWRDADLEVEEDARAGDGRGHGLDVLGLAMRLISSDVWVSKLLACETQWRCVLSVGSRSIVASCKP